MVRVPRANSRPSPFYRSPLTRAAFTGTGAFVTWGLSPAGPDQWHSTASLLWLHQALPWPIMWIGFAAYTLCQAWGQINAVIFADFLGLIMYGVAFFAILVTLDPEQILNPIALSAVFLACVLHYLAGRLAVSDRERAQ